MEPRCIASGRATRDRNCSGEGWRKLTIRSPLLRDAWRYVLAARDHGDDRDNHDGPDGEDATDYDRERPSADRC
jgi:hypothetical protein